MVTVHTLGPDMWRKEYFYQCLPYQGVRRISIAFGHKRDTHHHKVLLVYLWIPRIELIEE